MHKEACTVSFCICNNTFTTCPILLRCDKVLLQHIRDVTAILWHEKPYSLLLLDNLLIFFCMCVFEKLCIYGRGRSHTTRIAVEAFWVSGSNSFFIFARVHKNTSNFRLETPVASAFDLPTTNVFTMTRVYKHKYGNLRRLEQLVG